VHQKTFEENLGLLVIKNHLFMQFIENIWLKCLIMQLYHFFFPFPKKPSIKKCYQIWLKRQNKHMSSQSWQNVFLEASYCMSLEFEPKT